MKSKFLKTLLSCCENKKVAITGHRSPDFDCIGSCIAMHMILKQFNISSDIFVETCADEKFLRFAGKTQLKTASEETYDVCITVDCPSFSLIPDNVSKVFTTAKTTFCIDHHITNSKYATYNYVKVVSSACEVIYSLFKNSIKLTQDIARSLYIGIYTDTGGFKYSNTTSNTFKVLSNLLKVDIEPDKLVHEYVDLVTHQDFELTRCAFNSIQFFFDKQVAVSKISKEDLDKFSVDGNGSKFMQSYLQNLVGVKIAISIREKVKNEYNISLRTACDDIDVSKIASRFGGGGHIRASGLTLKGDYNKALNALLMECKNQLKGLKK